MSSVYLYTPLGPLSKCPLFWPVFEAAVRHSAAEVLILCRTSADVEMAKRLVVPIVTGACPRIETLDDFWRRLSPEPSLVKGSFRSVYLRQAVASYPVKSTDWFKDVRRFSGFSAQLDRFLRLIDRYGFDEQAYIHGHPAGVEYAESCVGLVRHLLWELRQYGCIEEASGDDGMSGLIHDALQSKTVVLFGFEQPTVRDETRLNVIFEAASMSMAVIPFELENWCYQAGRDGVEFVEKSPCFVRRFAGVLADAEVGRGRMQYAPTVWEYSSLEDELDGLVAFCRQLVNEHGEMAMAQLCVVDVGQRRALIEERLKSEGFQVASHASRRVGDTLLGEFLTVMIGLSVGTFDHRRFMALLTIPIWNFSDGYAHFRPFFSSLANQFNIQPGVDQWRFALASYMEFNQQDIELTQKAALFFDQLVIVLEQLRQANSAQMVYQVMVTTIQKWFGGMMSRPLDMDSSRQLMTEFMETLSFFDQVCGHFSTPNSGSLSSFDLSFFYSVLQDAFRSVVTPYSEGPSIGASVMDIGQFPIGEWQWVWVMGVSEAALPKRVTQTIFCPVSLYSRLKWPSIQSQEDVAMTGLAAWLLMGKSTRVVSYTGTASEILNRVFGYLGWDATPKVMNEFMPIKAQARLAPLPVRLAAGSVAERSMSVTSLETYQACPFRYYLKYVLKAVPIEAASEDVQASIWGQLIHSIFQKYYEELIRQKNGHNRELLFEIAKEVFDEVSQPTFYWSIKRDLLFGNEIQQGVLAAFLAVEERHPISLSPMMLEYEFKNIEMTLSDGSVLKLSGKIDAVLADTARRTVAGLDYKTGKSFPAPVDMEQFRTLQLPVYQWVIGKMMPEAQCVAGIIYQVRNPHDLGRHIVAVTEYGRTLFDLGRKRPAKLDETYYPRLVETMSRIYLLLKSGYFSTDLHNDLAHVHAQRPEVCRYCDYVLVCGYSRRFGGK